jgi:predicted 3-demethylubiquinone-9 3-methyltransferase (glyoxalase superfamily)
MIVSRSGSNWTSIGAVVKSSFNYKNAVFIASDQKNRELCFIRSISGAITLEKSLIKRR